MVRRNPVLPYFTLAVAISWTLWLPAVATAQGWWAVRIPTWWHYTGALGPVSAAFIVAMASNGRSGVLAILTQYASSRLRPGWLLFVTGNLVALLVLALVAARLAEGQWPTYDAFARTDNLPGAGLLATFLLHLLTFGIGEETGWRGFALPHLQESRTALRATGLLFLAWALWHVPTVFENPSFRDMSAATTAGWLIGLAMGAVFLTWLYNSTQASLLTLILWHGLFNTVTASEADSGVIAAVVTAGVMVTALVVLVVSGPRDLCGLTRQAGTRVRWCSLLPHGAQSPAAPVTQTPSSS